jgi:hypothetical protein
MNTPWGNSDGSRQFEPGIGDVSTPRHGGIYVSSKYAQDHLSAAARNNSINWGSYLFFEEDSEWMIPAWELKELRPEFFKYSRTAPEEWETELRQGLTYWHLSYALAAGIVSLDHLPERYYCPNLFKHENDYGLSLAMGQVICTCGHCFHEVEAVG